jgi:HSP20 family protein
MSSLAFRSFDPLFGDPLRVARALFDTPVRTPAPLAARFDVLETEDAFVFEADLPGVAEADVEVTIDGRTLSISATRERNERTETDSVHIEERSFGKLGRSFLLPDTADVGSVRANLDAGVLTVHVAKKAQVKPRKVPLGAKSTDELAAAS